MKLQPLPFAGEVFCLRGERIRGFYENPPPLWGEFFSFSPLLSFYTRCFLWRRHNPT
ncbi:hypothetical protein AGR1A_Lc40355 [Agrobacterium fabacearum CFBP 5771]|nr:hypothetical protein AGR1A_Lc40355 [Agrobacterium fabacearum CFBP 5771]